MICSHPSIIPTEEEIKDSIRFMRERYGTCGVSVEPNPLTSTEQVFYDSIDPFAPCPYPPGMWQKIITLLKRRVVGAPLHIEGDLTVMPELEYDVCGDLQFEFKDDDGEEPVEIIE